MISIGMMWQRIKQLKKDMAWSEQILEQKLPDGLMNDELLDIRQSEREMGRALGRIEAMNALGITRYEIPTKEKKSE